MKKLVRDTDKDLDYYYKMRDLYLNTEKQFLEFNEWVPMETNRLTVNSPRLYTVLLTACGQVEALLKKICQQIDEIPRSKNFPEYYKKLNVHGMLGMQRVTVYRKAIKFNPFNKKEVEHFWWTSHNEAKHELPEGIEKGTIKNVLYALAGVHVLQKIYLSIPHDEPKKILDTRYWAISNPITISDVDQHRETYSNSYDSNIFSNHNNFYWTGL